LKKLSSISSKSISRLARIESNRIQWIFFNLRFGRFWLRAVLIFSVPAPFTGVHQLYGFHLNQILTWDESNLVHFRSRHFGRLWFHAMLRCFVRAAFPPANHLK
jgi:hypothetical protein